MCFVSSSRFKNVIVHNWFSEIDHLKTVDAKLFRSAGFEVQNKTLILHWKLTKNGGSSAKVRSSSSAWNEIKQHLWLWSFTCFLGNKLQKLSHVFFKGLQSWEFQPPGNWVERYWEALQSVPGKPASKLIYWSWMWPFSNNKWTYVFQYRIVAHQTEWK